MDKPNCASAAAYIVAFLLLSSVFALVLLNRASAQDYLTLVGAVLGGGGVHLVHVNFAKKRPDSAFPPFQQPETPQT